MCHDCNYRFWLDDMGGQRPDHYLDALPEPRRELMRQAYGALLNATHDEDIQGCCLHMQVDDDNYECDWDGHEAYWQMRHHAWAAPTRPLLACIAAGRAWNLLTEPERTIVVAWRWNYWAELPRPVVPLDPPATVGTFCLWPGSVA